MKIKMQMIINFNLSLTAPVRDNARARPISATATLTAPVMPIPIIPYIPKDDWNLEVRQKYL